MAKWFFLAVAISLTCIGNLIAFDADVGLVSKALAFLAVNIFGLSLLAFWSGGYEQRPERKAKLLVVGHAALILSAGLAFAGWGYHGLHIDDCAFLVRDSGHRSRWISDLARWADEHRACSWFSSALIAFGAYLLWPSAKFFYRLTRDVGRTSET
jgi:hypothetical protein